MTSSPMEMQFSFCGKGFVLADSAFESPQPQVVHVIVNLEQRLEGKIGAAFPADKPASTLRRDGAGF